jgi:hypothetical protein
VSLAIGPADPIAFALAADGRGGMLVPRLEVEHARANAAVQEVAS